jgi:uroporphyrinogen-III decarboxylase
MSISNRERFKAIARFQRQGDLFTYDIFWPETLSNWVRQGAPEQILNPDSNLVSNPFFKEYFKYCDKQILFGIKSGCGEFVIQGVYDAITPMNGSPLVPGYEIKIIAEDEHTVTYVNGNGQTVKSIKNSFSMPMFLDWPVKDKSTWKEHKKRLDPNTPERWPANWNAYVLEVNSQDRPTVLQVGSLFGLLRDWIGSERFLYMFYDDPGLIEDMMDHMVYFETEIIKRIVKDIKIDQADFYEDMAYKAGPLISPNMMKKFMVPRYKKITELLHSNGIDIISVDSDGDVVKLIPLWLESGINYILPLEQAAGNDAVALRKKYGKDLIMGGAIDKRALIKGKEAIKAEVISKVHYLLEKGGYFPSVDHAVPPDVTFENYCYYINLLREVAGLEKLSF